MSNIYIGLQLILEPTKRTYQHLNSSFTYGAENYGSNSEDGNTKIMMIHAYTNNKSVIYIYYKAN